MLVRLFDARIKTPVSLSTTSHKERSCLLRPLFFEVNGAGLLGTLLLIDWRQTRRDFNVLLYHFLRATTVGKVAK